MPSWLWSREFLWASTIVSVLLFAGTLVIVPVVCVRMPADYFVAPIPKRSWLAITARTLVAVVLIGLGAAMLVLPGQGMLTILFGISLLDFPAKRRVERRILGSRTVFSAVNKLRQTRGKPPFLRP